MPPALHVDLLPALDGGIILTHSQDKLCAQAPKGDEAWDLIWQAGAGVVHMDMDDRRNDQAAYGASSHSLLWPFLDTAPGHRYLDWGFSR